MFANAFLALVHVLCKYSPAAHALFQVKSSDIDEASLVHVAESLESKAASFMDHQVQLASVIGVLV
jgi:hypothetical protein